MRSTMLFSMKQKQFLFNCSDDLHGTGSSILTRATGNDGYHVMEVAAIRMDKFMEEHHIDHIDFLKLDVEGCNWEVLDSFGQKLSQVKSIHTEAEHVLTKGWKEGKSYDDIRDLLENHGFELFHFERIRGFQSDSFWINKRYLKKNSAN